jgi:hypothetical protein
VHVASVLTPEPLVVAEGNSVVAPLAIAGLPEHVDALGGRWQRKSEFHLTAIAARVLERLELGRPWLWELVERLASGRSLGPVAISTDVRRASDPEKPELRTLLVIADCPGLSELYRELSAELDVELPAPPAHVTLYSTDPDEGIGIVDRRELRERAPALSAVEQERLRQAMRFDAAFGLSASRLGGS